MGSFRETLKSNCVESSALKYISAHWYAPCKTQQRPSRRCCLLLHASAEHWGHRSGAVSSKLSVFAFWMATLAWRAWFWGQGFGVALPHVGFCCLRCDLNLGATWGTCELKKVGHLPQARAWHWSILPKCGILPKVTISTFTCLIHMRNSRLTEQKPLELETSWQHGQTVLLLDSQAKTPPVCPAPLLCIQPICSQITASFFSPCLEASCRGWFADVGVGGSSSVLWWLIAEPSREKLCRLCSRLSCPGYVPRAHTGSPDPPHSGRRNWNWNEKIK